MQAAFSALIAPVALSAAIIIIMMQIAFWRNAKASWWLSIAALLVTIGLCLPLLGSGQSLQVTPLLIADEFSLLFTVLILFATLITVILAYDYLHYRAGENEEFYLLLMLSALGAIILVSANHLASFLLGLELLGVALYGLIAYPERGHLPLEAAVKYLILSGAASAILLFGFALIYAALGTLSFADIGQQLSSQAAANNELVILAGTAMIFTGIGFKLSLVPFHMWTPDVYEGAPSPITGFLATVSKGAIFAALLRLFIAAELYRYDGLLSALSLIAIASMLAGNLLALRQKNLKRLLAYSSIAHLGYLLITLVVFGELQRADLAVEATSFYLVAYVLTSLAAFALLTIICNNIRESDTGDLKSIRGLFWRQPSLALMFTVALLSLAGIPMTAGFVGKFYLFSVGISAELWWLLGALVIGSAIGIYYYLRVIFTMAQSSELAILSKNSWAATTVIWLLIAAILYFGVLPQGLMDYLSGLQLAAN